MLNSVSLIYPADHSGHVHVLLPLMIKLVLYESMSLHTLVYGHLGDISVKGTHKPASKQIM